MRTLVALLSLCFLLSAKAHQGRPRGNSHPHNHQHQPRDCHDTFVARSQDDLADYESLRIQSGVDRKLHIDTNITATDLRIATDCEIKIKTKVIFNITGVLTLFAEKIDFGNKVVIRAKDLYLKTDKKIKLDDDLEITTERMYIESSDEIKFKNKSILASNVGIFNAPDCDVKPRATRLVTQELGTCFGKAPFLIDLAVTPVIGEAPLNVNFDASKSFGLLDTFVYHFGTGDTLTTLNEGAAYVYVTPGTFSVRLEAKGSFGSLFTALKTIEITTPPVASAEIFHQIVRINPPAVIYTTKEVPALENMKEFLWDFGDNSSIAIPFSFSQVGFAFHDYATEADYAVKLRLKDQANFVTAPVEKLVSTFADALPVPRYAINTFKGEAPLTVDVQALETTDAYGQPMRFEWFFTDTMESIEVGSTRQVQHTFTQPGIYQVQLGLTDSRGAVRSVLIPIYVGQANALTSLPPFPVIDATERYGEAPLTVNFTAVGSFDADGVPGQPLTYQWTFFDNGRNQNVSFFGQNFSYTFIKPAVAQVRLIVTDVTGQQGSTVIPVYVSGPTSNPGGFIVAAGTGARTYNFNVNPFMIENTYSYESILWDFGDGTQSRFQNTPHTFPGVGDYPVTLKIRKLDGDFETYTQVVRVVETPVAQTATISTNGNRYNLNEPKTFTALTNIPQDALAAKFTWHFGDGSSTSGIGSAFSSTSHIYSSPGQYRVTLHTQFASGLANYAQFVMTANAAPTIGPVKLYRVPAIAPAIIGFAPGENTVDTDGFIQNYVYEFGDGSAPVIASQGYLEHTYQLAGTYTVIITAIDNNGGRASRSFNLTIASNQAPIARIKVYQLGALIAPARIGFAGGELSSDSDGFIPKYEFDFGDGVVTQATQGYLEHDYPLAGTYRLGLRVQDDKGLWSEKVFYDLVVLANQIPIADFDVSVFDGIAPGQVGVEIWKKSRDLDGFIAGYEYNFGDGQIFTDTDGYEPHFYSTAGTYAIQVRVRDNKGAWSLPVEKTVTIAPNQRPIAINTIYNNDYIAPTKLGMNAGVSSFDPDGYLGVIEYDFGDGTYVTRNPSQSFVEHEYTVPGPYIVRVRVSDNDGLWSDYASTSIQIKPNQTPIARLRLEKSGTELPIVVTALAWDSSDADGFIPKFIYDLGDGNPVESTSGSTTFSFDSYGTKTIGLRVQDNKGALSARVQAQINLMANQAPIANFTATVFDPIAPGRVGIEAYQQSTDADGYLTQFEYDLGDGTVRTTNEGYIEHGYLVAGTYIVRVRVQDDKQLWSEYATKQVVIRENQAPVVITSFFQSSQYAPADVQVNAWDTIDTDGFISEYLFDFGDGTVVSSTQAFQQHTFTLPGVYLVKVEAIDNKGASGFASFQIEIKQNASPIAQLNLNPGEPFFVGREITASAFGSLDPDGIIVDYQIDWGDGARSSGVEAKHTYSTAGLYDVRLTLRDDFGNTSELVSSIDVTENAPPMAEIQVSPETLKQYEILTFEAINAVDPEGHSIAYSWEFSDGEKDYGKKVPKFFKDPGSFTAKLVLIDEYGAKTEVTRTVEVEESDLSLPSPVISVNDTNGMTYHLVVANGKKSSSTLSEIASYEWDWGDGSPLESGVEVSHEYAESGEYTLKLKVTDTEGNSNTTFKVIQYEDIEYDYEAISDANLLIAGLDLKGFNPRNGRVELFLEGRALAGGVTSVRINGVDVALIENSAIKIAFNASWQDDRNVLRVETYDENGGKVAEEFVVYAGSRTIQFELSNVTPDTVLKLHHTEDKDIFEEVSTSQNGIVSIANVPAKTTFVFASNPQGQIAHDLLSSSENALIIPMEDFAAPAPANFDLANGAAGWVSSQGTVSVAGSEQNKFAEISLTSGREVILSHTAQPNFDKPFVVSKREYRSANPAAVVFSVLRDSEGRVEYSFARMDEGLLRNGEYFLTPDPLSLGSSLNTTLETRIALYSLENATSKQSHFAELLHAHAQSTSGVSGRVMTREAGIILRDLRLKSINWQSGVKNERFNHLEACGIGFGANVPGSFDQFDPRFSFVVETGVQQEVEVVGVVGSWVAGEAVQIGAIKAILVPNNPSIGLSDDRCTANDSGALRRTCVFGSEYTETLLPLGSVSIGNFEVAYLNQQKLLGEEVQFNLVIMSKERFQALGGEQARVNILNNYLSYASGVDVHVVEAASKCGKENLKKWPVFYKADGLVQRFGKSDAVEIDGDSWSQSHVLAAASQMEGIKFNDFSTKYGNFFYQHAEHEEGLDSDFVNNRYSDLRDLGVKTYVGGRGDGTNEICSTRLRTAQITKRLDYSFIASLKDAFSLVYRDVENVIGTFYFDSPVSNQLSTNKCKDSDSYYLESNEIEKVILANSQIIRSPSKLSDLDFFKKRTCLGKRTLGNLLRNEKSGGHTDHWHIDWLPYHKRSSVDYPFNNDKYESKADIEYEEDQALMRLRVPHLEGAHVYADIFFVDSNGKENRLYQYDADDVSSRPATCHDPILKSSSGAYVGDVSWCNDGWGFLPTPTINGRDLTFTISKSLLTQNLRKLEDLRVRYVTVLRNSVEGYCKEQESFLIDASASCADGSADPGLGDIHPNGGGFVAYNAYVHPEAFVGEGSRVCPGSTIESAEVELLGNTIISGNTSISGCVTVSSNSQGDVIINGFGSGVKVMNDCSRGNNFRTLITGPSLVEGEVEITAPVYLFNIANIAGHENGATGSSKVIIDGTCNYRGQLATNGVVNEVTPEHHIQGPVHISNCISSYSSQMSDLRAVGMTGIGNFFTPVQIGYSIIEGDVYLGNFVSVQSAVLKSSNLVGPNAAGGASSGYVGSQTGEAYQLPFFKMEDSELLGNFFVRGANVKTSNFDCFPYMYNDGCIVTANPALNLTFENMSVRGASYICDQTTGSFDNEYVCNGMRKPLTGYQQ